MKKQSIFCWFVLLFIALGLIFHLHFQEAGRVRLSSAPPPQLTVEEIAEIEFYAQDVSDAAVYSTADTVAKIEIQSAENGRIRCQVTARSPGSASLSCKANGRQSPAFAISVVEAPEPVLTSGAFLSSKNSEKYHLASCPYAQKIAEENRVYWACAADAEAAGLTSCKKCLPQ